MSSQAKIVTRVLGEELEKFEADNICLRQCMVKQMGGQTGHRSEFTEWHDAPPIATVVTGSTPTISNFNEITHLAVPHKVTTYYTRPFKLNNNDTLDPSELSRQMRAAMQAIDAGINRAVVNKIVEEGGQFVGRTSALSGFADIAAVDTLLTSQDVSQETGKTMILNASDYNSMASDLANRETLNGRAENAYDRAFVGQMAGFDTFKTSFTPSKTAAAPTGITVNGANQDYDPSAADLSGNEPMNIDNRTATLTVSGTISGAVAGDKFTIAGVNAVSLVNKNDTGNLRTFTVTGVSGQDITYSPPIIVDSGAPNSTVTQARDDYANCTAAPANSAAVTFVNYDTALTNVFFENESVCINTAPVVGTEEQLGGMILMNETTERGLNIIVAKQGAISDLSTEWRVTARAGVTVRDPIKCGILMGAQTA